MKRLGFVLACVVLVASACSLPSVAPGTLGFPNGVAAGDVTASGATLWTRTSAEASVELKVYDWVLQPNSALMVPGDTPIFTATATTSAADDFTTKVQVGGLQPHHVYFYRFTNASEQSQLGRFVTAPAANDAASFRFVVAADSDGFPVDGPPAFNNFEVLNWARAAQPDFFAFLGDTIYSDSSFAPPGGVTTLAQYRAAHEQNRSFAYLRDLMSATGTYAQIDDHEVYNDFDGETVDPGRYADGLHAFNDWMPTNAANVLDDPTCAGGHPRYFHQKWGTQAEIFQLDERSCRSSQDPVKAVCTNPGPSLDLAPTAPSFLRLGAGLPESPPAGCVDAINDPARTLLGPVQKAAFESDLLASNAKFKIVLSEDAIQQFYALPYDRWEGYGGDRSEILNFIRTNVITNVVFLTTDLHANIANNVFIDKTTDPTPIAYEAISGPIATNTYKNEILNAFPANGEALVNSLQLVLTIQGVECRALDSYSYQLVEVNAGAGTLTISSRGPDGKVLSDDVIPTKKCTKTIGP
ncbi:MAG: alkaline phosphatase D family protein [Acidimicrobiia bacterium]|nr:alkaline phosphatase D family protein [Acidimicrobiia bacterium]